MLERLASTEGVFTSRPQRYCLGNHGEADDFFWGRANAQSFHSAQVARVNLRGSVRFGDDAQAHG